MKVLLVNPSRFYSGNWGGGELSHLFVLFSYLRKHCPEVEVDVLDLERELSTPEDAASEQYFLRLARMALESSDFDVVGISCWTSLHYLSSLAIARLCKELNPACTVVVGGYHPSSLPQDFAYPNTPFDYVVIGEGEVAFADIVRGKIARTGPAQVVLGTKLDTSEQVLFWDEYKYYRNTGKVQLWLTRGCPFSCGFCLDRNTKWRGYAPDRALEEIRRAHQLLPTLKKISIMDPIFGLGKEWRRAVLDGMIALDLPVGYWAETRSDVLEAEDIARLGQLDFQMDIGLDSVSPRMIGIMMKARNPADYLQSFLETSARMDEHKVTHLIYGIFNYPGETPATLEETRRFWLDYYAKRPGGYGLFLSQPFAYFPGCEVFNNFKQYEVEYGARVLAPEWWKIARPSHIKMAAQVIPSKELEDAKGLFTYKDIQKSINVLATKTVERAVVERFLFNVSQVRDANLSEKKFKPAATSHIATLPDQRKAVFNFDREEAREFSREESAWLDALLSGQTPKQIGAGQRIEKFVSALLQRNYLQVDPGPLRLEIKPRKLTIETNLGEMRFDLLPEEAPHTVANFARLALGGYYDRMPIGQACRGSFVEAGSLMPRDPGPAAAVAADSTSRGHQRGTLSMNPSANAATFTLCRDRFPDFDGLRTVFGVMTHGYDVLDELLVNDLIVAVRISG